MSVKTKPKKVVLRIGLRKPYPIMITDLQGVESNLGFTITFRDRKQAIDVLKILIARLERLE